jgi:hypothetical protein
MLCSGFRLVCLPLLSPPSATTAARRLDIGHQIADRRLDLGQLDAAAGISEKELKQ